MVVIPAINCADFECVKKRLEIAKDFSDWVHIDVVDGKFAPNVTWGSPEEWASLKPPLNLEVHLMVADPETQADRWLRHGVKRVVVHLESLSDPIYVLEKCKKYGAEAMLAINPKTEVERLLAHKDDFKYFQILAVYPGLAGQKFLPEMIEKIKFLRKNLPDVIIEVDGGINPETAKLVNEVGADIAVSASYIFNSKNYESAYRSLLNATKH